MKKTIVFLLAMLMLTLTACGDKGSAPSAPANNDNNSAPSAEVSEPAAKSNHVTAYKVDVPDGFESMEQEGVVECWYNADGSNINVNITEGTDNETFSAINADLMRMALVSAFKDSGSEAPTITDRYFTTNEVCGLPAYQYSYDIELGGQAMTQIIVCVNADQTYPFTYTTTGSDWLEAFEASAAAIELTIE